MSAAEFGGGTAIIKAAWFKHHEPKVPEHLVVPNADKQAELDKIIKNGFIHGNIMSIGKGGVGKTTMNKILSGLIVKHSDDIHVLGRTVKHIEEKLIPWLKQPRTASAQRLVVCEEFDQLSKQAQTLLKDGLIEKYQPNVAYLVTTNHPGKIDAALKTRFNIKFDFNKFDNIIGIVNRMEQILQVEKVEYTRENLELFVNNYIHLGIRDLVNNLESACISGTLNANYSGMIVGGENEILIVNTVKYLLHDLMFGMYDEQGNQTFAGFDVNTVYQFLINVNADQTFGHYYNDLVQKVLNDPNLDFDDIMDRLLQNPQIGGNPVYAGIIRTYWNTLERVRFKDQYFITLIGDMLKAVYELKGGVLIQRDQPLMARPN